MIKNTKISFRFQKDLPNRLINIDDFEKQNKIGEGGFSKVYLVKKSGKSYAAKVFKTEIFNNEQFKNLSREINIISQIEHRSIIKYVGYSAVDFKKRPKPVIITEYVTYGSLRDIISSQQQNPGKTILISTQKLIILYGIASSMLYLHSQKIIHRDLKPENVFIDDFYFPKIPVIFTTAAEIPD